MGKASRRTETHGARFHEPGPDGTPLQQLSATENPRADAFAAVLAGRRAQFLYPVELSPSSTREAQTPAAAPLKAETPAECVDLVNGAEPTREPVPRQHLESSTGSGTNEHAAEADGTSGEAQAEIQASTVTDGIQKPRHTLLLQVTVLDAPSEWQTQIPFAAMLVPRGFESDWEYSEEGGQWQLLNGSGAQRLLLISRYTQDTLSPSSRSAEEPEGRLTKTAEEVEDLELKRLLRPLIIATAPFSALKSAVEQQLNIPFLAFEDNVLWRDVLEVMHSQYTGGIVVEDVELDLDFMGNKNRSSSSSRRDSAGVRCNSAGVRCKSAACTASLDVVRDCRMDGTEPSGRLEANCCVPDGEEQCSVASAEGATQSEVQRSQAGIGLCQSFHGEKLACSCSCHSSCGRLHTRSDSLADRTADRNAGEPRGGRYFGGCQSVWQRGLCRELSSLQFEGDGCSTSNGRNHRTAFRRRLRFQRTPNLIQSEVPLGVPQDALDPHYDLKLFPRCCRKAQYHELVHKYLAPIVAGFPLISSLLAHPPATPEARRMLVLGGGAFTLPIFLSLNFPHQIHVVELDPVLVDLAHRHFGLEETEQLQVHLGDALAYMRRKNMEVNTWKKEEPSGASIKEGRRSGRDKRKGRRRKAKTADRATSATNNGNGHMSKAIVPMGIQRLRCRNGQKRKDNNGRGGLSTDARPSKSGHWPQLPQPKESPCESNRDALATCTANELGHANDPEVCADNDGHSVEHVQDLTDEVGSCTDPRFDLIVLDIDAPTAKSELSSPPQGFVSAEMLKCYRTCLHPKGMLAMNVVPSCEQGLRELVEKLKGAFAEVYQSKVEEDVNVVLYGLMESVDMEHVGSMASALEGVIAMDLMQNVDRVD